MKILNKGRLFFKAINFRFEVIIPLLIYTALIIKLIL